MRDLLLAFVFAYMVTHLTPIIEALDRFLASVR